MIKKQNYTRAEARCMEAASLTKMIAIVGFVVAMIAFSSIAWFTMNREVEGEGVQMKSGGEKFEISSPTGLNRSAGSWYDPYHMKIMGISAENQKNPEIPSDVWLLTAESNFGNYQNNEGIKPGSYGKISFNVTPLIDTIDMQFAFDVVGYHSSDSAFNNQDDDKEEDQELTLTPLADMGDKEAGIAEYLNGHILLFENRTPIYENTTDPDTHEVITTNTILGYTYSGLISTNEDMQRVLKNTAKTHFTGRNTATPVDIYWIWPNTLSNLVNVGDKDDATPFCTGEDLAEITAYVLEHPQYFLKGYTANVSGGSGDETPGEGGDAGEGSNEEENNASVTQLTLDGIIADYATYGDMYDMADNDIGMNVNYILLKLVATENTSNSSATPDP